MLLPRSGKVELAWNLEKGSVLRYEMTQSLRTNMSGGRKTEQATLFRVRLDVMDVENGVASLNVTFDRVKVARPGMQSEYDSRSGAKPAEQDLMARVLAEMVGRSFTMNLTETGRIIDVRGFSDMVAKIVDAIEPDDRHGMASHWKEQFSDDRIATMMQNAFWQLPTEAVTAGSSWKHDGVCSIDRVGPLAAKSRFKVVSITDETVAFKTRSTLDSVEGDGVDSHGAAEIWSAEIEGKSTWNTAHGRLEASTAETRVIADSHGREFEVVITSTTTWVPLDKRQ